MSGDIDPALLELFREEVRANVQLLNDGLVALEQDPANTGRIEPLMRAAHSIKGAARVVNIDEAVALAHAAEDCLVAAQEGKIRIESQDIDALLAAADLLAGIAESAGPSLPQWLAHSRQEIAGLATALQQRARVEPSTEPRSRSRPPAAAPGRGADKPALADSLAAAIRADKERSFEDSPLLELFCTECQLQSEFLRNSLPELELGHQTSESLAALTKAAKAIRSAARLVNVCVGVELAAAIEGVLDGALLGSAELAPTQIKAIDQLAAALSQLAQVVGPEYAAWLSASADDLAVPLSLLQPDQQSRAPRADTAPVESAIEADPHPPAATPPPKPPEPAKAPPKHAEQVVRVSAQSLTRLMGLAGESLVEARWLQPYSASLLELKRQQARLSESLEFLDCLSPSDDSGDRRAAMLTEAREQLAECQRTLSAQMSEFESRARNTDALSSRLYHEVIASRMRPLADGVQGFPRMVRDLARQLGKQVTFRILGETVDVDRDILEKLEAPLNHLLRNALDHGLETPAQRIAAGKPETCLLELEARHNAGMLVVTVRDDGAGIDLEKVRARVIERKLADPRMAAQFNEAELLEFLFLPAFSTTAQVTEVSGRGVGLDVVQSMAQSVGGSVRIQSRLGVGTTFRLEMPITLSVIRAVLVSIAGEPYAFPHNRIDQLVQLSHADLHSLENRQFFQLDGRNVGIVLASQIFELEGPPADREGLFAVLFSHNGEQYGLLVDEFCGERDLVVTPLDPRLGKVPNINAAAILDDGSPVLIVDVDDLRRSLERKLRDPSLGRAAAGDGTRGKRPAQRVLVVDDSITVREVQRQLLLNHGYDVEVAVDGMEGWNTLLRSQFDLVISDIDMPRLNGIDFVRRIKQDSQLRNTPVMIVSYKDREEDRLRGLEAGADYYLTKSSFHDDTLIAAVQDLIGEAQR
ncbi:MAG: hybrid sensor histidine kinase/response regulator [Planctomycetaceae bacterium]|nr:hybrid sensor histidine kinase/response regulator [Planctomycetaceae bacterium]